MSGKKSICFHCDNVEDFPTCMGNVVNTLSGGCITIPYKDNIASCDNYKKIPHLCETCQHIGDFPICLDDKAEMGDGPYHDNIIQCVNYDNIEEEGTYHAE